MRQPHPPYVNKKAVILRIISTPATVATPIIPLARPRIRLARKGRTLTMPSCSRNRIRALIRTQFGGRPLPSGRAIAISAPLLDGSRIITKGSNLASALLHLGIMLLVAEHHSFLKTRLHFLRAPTRVAFGASNADAIQRSSLDIELHTALLGSRGRTSWRVYRKGLGRCVLRRGRRRRGNGFRLRHLLAFTRVKGDRRRRRRFHRCHIIGDRWAQRRGGRKFSALCRGLRARRKCIM